GVIVAVQFVAYPKRRAGQIGDLSKSKRNVLRRGSGVDFRLTGKRNRFAIDRHGFNFERLCRRRVRRRHGGAEPKRQGNQTRDFRASAHRASTFWRVTMIGRSYLNRVSMTGPEWQQKTIGYPPLKRG